MTISIAPLKFPLQLLPLRPALARSVLLAGGGLVFGQWLLNDLLHVPGGGLGLLAGGAALLWLSRRPAAAQFRPPATLQGWIERCESVLDQFELFEGDAVAAAGRSMALQQVIDRDGPLQVGLVCVDSASRPELGDLQRALAGSQPLQLSTAHPLSSSNGERQWPSGLGRQDLILFSLSAPLMAADLLWLHQLPEDQPGWLLVSTRGDQTAAAVVSDLGVQLEGRWADRLLVREQGVELRKLLLPLRSELRSTDLQAGTRQRLLADLHRRWQRDLERLRRERFQTLQLRTQWVVAGSVFASPLASVDLLALAVANGLMIHEMAAIWGSPAKADVLQEAAAQLARAALAQGVVEWTGQTLIGLAKLDGGSWLAAGAIQALSAAYLTRVVGRSMADWLALSAGVAEPDLVALRQQAPVLVARAAEEERLNWAGFLNESRQWLLQATS